MRIPKIGTRVRFQPTPASLLLYTRPPAPGSTGTVTEVSVGARRVHFMPGPGSGLLYVRWDSGMTMGVSPRDVVLAGDLGESPAAFKRGDRVVDITNQQRGQIWAVGDYDSHLGDRRYHVMLNGGRTKIWKNGKNLRRLTNLEGLDPHIREQWDAKQWRKPDAHIEDYAIWYGPGGAEGENATEVEISDGYVRVSEWTNIVGLVDNPEADFLVTTVQLDISEILPILRKHRLPTNTSLDMMRSAVGLGVAKIGYYGGEEEFKDELPRI